MKSVSGLRLQYTTLVLNSHFRLMSDLRISFYWIHEDTRRI